ncbi:integrase, catalytic region, zinc finger, CCHC-type containing protein [Tanacetum coccineum]
MKDVFESTENDLSKTWKQNELLKYQLLEAKHKHEIECCMLLSYECVNNKVQDEIEKIQRDSIEIQEGMQKQINILENDVQRCQKQSLDFELKLQHEKERQKCESSLKNICETSWISKMEKLERLSAASSVRRPLNRDSPLKNRVLSNTKKSSEKVEVSVRTNKKTYAASKNVQTKKLRALFTTPRKAKTAFEDTNHEVSKTRFSIQTTQSKSLDTTTIVSRTKIAAVTPISDRNKVVQIVLWIVDSGFSKHMTGDNSLLKNFVEKFMGTVHFGNDHFAAITGYGDYVQRNIIVFHVYYVEGLGHNHFNVGKFCDSDLEVAFRSNTCFVRNLEGDDLLTGARKSNLYTITISDMAASSPGKSKKSSHPPKLVPSTHSKLELLHMDLCGPIRVATINGKKYILVIVDDYSRFTWVYLLHTKDETTEIIKKFIAQVQLNFNAKVYKIRTDNGTEFKNATLKAHYEKLGIMQSIARIPQQNGVVERPESMHTPSKEDLDNLFGPMYEEYFEKRSSDMSTNSAAQQVHNHEDSSSTSSIIVEEHEAPPIITTSEEQTSPISLNEADEFNQEDYRF